MHHKRLTAILLTALLCVQTTAPAMAAEVETVQDQVAAEASSDGGISEEEPIEEEPAADEDNADNREEALPAEAEEEPHVEEEAEAIEETTAQEAAETVNEEEPEEEPADEENTAQVPEEESTADKDVAQVSEEEQEEGKENTSEDQAEEEEIVVETEDKEAGYEAAYADGQEVTVSLYGEQNLTYTGYQVKPLLRVRYGTTTIAEGKGYEVSYENNINVGTATAHLTGIGSYSFSKDFTYEIGPHVITEADVQTNLGAYELRYSPHSHGSNTYLVAVGSKILTKGTDYTITNEADFKNNVSGTVATITGMGNCTGSTTISIPKYDPMTVSISGDFVHSMPMEPVVSVKIGDKTLTKGAGEGDGDYYVKVTKKSDRMAQVEVLGQYEGAEIYEYKSIGISPYTITDGDIQLEKQEYEYTGSDVKPAATVTANGLELVEDTDYVLQYKDNYKEGMATVTATGVGNYKGTATAQFKITKTPTPQAQITAELTEAGPFEYDGREHKPDVTVKADGNVISNGYTVTYSDNVNAGTGKAEIKGSYNGTAISKTLTFTISPKMLTEEEVTINNAENPEAPAVYCNRKLLVSGTDYDISITHVTEEQISITLTGKGNYTGTLTLEGIDPNYNDPTRTKITEANVTAVLENYNTRYESLIDAYNEIIVEVNGETLEEGKDYTIKNKEAFEISKGNATVVGMGDYYGSVTVVVPEYPKMWISGEADFTYGDLPEVPAVTIIMGKGTAQETTLKQGTGPDDGDYYVRYGQGTDMNTPAGNNIYYFAIGKFDGATIWQEFLVFIKPHSITDSEVGLSGTTFNETGKAITPEVTVTAGNKELTAGTDYYVTYKNNVSAGTAKAIVTGKGNYTGTVEKTFTIKEKAETVKKITPVVTLSSSAFTYNGKDQKPSVTVKDGSAVLKASDYTVAYPAASVNAGTYKVTVTLKGAYAGSGTASYKIVPKKISPAVTLSKTAFTYNEKTQRPTVTVRDGSAVLKTSDYSLAWSGDGVNAGTYKVTVTLKGSYSGTGTASYKIAPKKVTPKVTLSAKRFTYNGKVRKPSVTVKNGSTVLASPNYTVTYAKGCKNVGKYKVTVKLKGNYTGPDKSVSFIINPKPTKVTKFEPVKNKLAFTVKWKKQTKQVTGYQVQYSTDKNFKKNVKKVTIKGAKKTSVKLTKGIKSGTYYYVRVRTYKKVGKKTYYSVWQY